jgi:GntR family carbon starvation induced transcriptional regulator
MKRSVAKIVEPEGTTSTEFRTLGEAVYARLRQDIVWGHLPAGAPLRSDRLREAYGIGISPLREALSRLVAERLVTTVGQRGFRVAPLTTADVADTLETRLLIEGEALARSIRRGDIGWETRVVASFHALSRVPVPTRAGTSAELWFRHHRQFHLALLDACGSPWLLELAGLLFDQAERHRAVRARIAPRPKLVRDTAAEHKKLCDAVLARNAKAALRALDRHYRTTADQVLTALQHVPKIK